IVTFAVPIVPVPVLPATDGVFLPGLARAPPLGDPPGGVHSQGPHVPVDLLPVVPVALGVLVGEQQPVPAQVVDLAGCVHGQRPHVPVDPPVVGPEQGGVGSEAPQGSVPADVVDPSALVTDERGDPPRQLPSDYACHPPPNCITLFAGR